MTETVENHTALVSDSNSNQKKPKLFENRQIAPVQPSPQVASVRQSVTFIPSAVDSTTYDLQETTTQVVT